MKNLIAFSPPLEEVKFLGREKRFFAIVRRADGTEYKVHIANSGSMKSCMVIGAPAYIRDSQNSDCSISEIATNFRPASEIDPKYGELIQKALDADVAIRILVSAISLDGLSVRGYFNLSHIPSVNRFSNCR
jgi:DNA-binding sugar fermentation-stimulating protein